MKGQKQCFQIEFERIRGKLKKLESRSKLLENLIKTLKSPGRHISQKTRLTKAVSLSSSDIQHEGEKRQTSELRNLEGSQTQHEIETSVTKAFMLN